MGSLGLGNGSLRLDDVYLEGATPDGLAVVGHLSVIVDTGGITVLGPEPGERRTVEWERMSPLEFGPPAVLPGGQPVTSLEFVVDGRPLRLLVPAKGEPVGSQELLVEPSGDLAVGDTYRRPDLPADVAAPVVPEPVTAENPEPVTAESPEPVTAESPEPVIASNPEPVTAESPEPVTAESPEPVIASNPEPVTAESPEPVTAESPEPVTAESPAPVDVDELASAAPPEAAPPVHPFDAPVTDPVVEESASDDDDEAPTLPRVWFRPYLRQSQHSRKPALSPAQRMLRLVLVTVLVGLVPVAAGVWYFHLQPSPTRSPGKSPSDMAIAARVGIQPGDLPGWSATAPRMGNPFAAGATTQGAAALGTAQRASTVLARCLHVPVSAVDGAFGMGSAVSQRTAQVSSPSYADPSGNQGAVSSVVDVVKNEQIQQADSDVFQNPALFATCYQPFVQAMLPYATGGGAAGFATATVQPVVVPVPTGPADVEVAAFQIARIANEQGQTTTVVTTAIAVFDGRVQATLGTVSDFVFSLDAQNQLVRDMEIRTIGVSQL